MFTGAQVGLMTVVFSLAVMVSGSLLFPDKGPDQVPN